MFVEHNVEKCPLLGAGTAGTRRLLLLSSLETMGKELTVAQMQGSIQVEAMPGRGHHLQEEDPLRVAGLLGGLAGPAEPS